MYTLGMLQFGLRAHDFGKLPPEQLALSLSYYKPSSIQLALAKALSGTPSESGMLTPGYARRIKKAFDAHNIAISVLGCYINPVHPDPHMREKALRKFEEHLAACRDFGCAVVGTETGSCNADCSYNPSTQNESTFDLLCSSVERMVNTAEKYGVRVGIEPVAHQHTIDSAEKMQRLIERIPSPNLSVIFDPVNLIPLTGFESSQEVFFDKAFDAFGEKIAVIHAKDFVLIDGKKKGDLPSGTGDLNYEVFFKKLIEKKPFIDVLLENSIPSKLEETFSFLQSVITKISTVV